MNNHRVGKPRTPTKHHGLQIAAFDQLLPGLVNIQPHCPLPGQENLASSAGHLSNFSGHLLLPLGYLNPPLPLLCPAIFLTHKFEQHLLVVYAFLVSHLPCPINHRVGADLPYPFQDTPSASPSLASTRGLGQIPGRVRASTLPLSCRPQGRIHTGCLRNSHTSASICP